MKPSPRPADGPLPGLPEPTRTDDWTGGVMGVEAVLVVVLGISVLSLGLQATGARRISVDRDPRYRPRDIVPRTSLGFHAP